MDNNRCIAMYNDEKFAIQQFMKRIVNFFQDNPKLNTGELHCVHSVKFRMKSEDHLVEKLDRKRKEGREINESNFFNQITDLAGVRVLHLYQDQARMIHEVIMDEVNKKEWVLAELPKAYTWDVDAKKFYDQLKIETEIKPSYYTSIHYVVMPNEGSKIKCEIQVRTLWEESWGEIEHFMRYKNNNVSDSCKEQLKVLAQIAGAGVKLSDAIIKYSNNL